MRVGTCLSASAGLTTALALVPRDIQNVEVQQAGAKAATAQQISAYAAAAEKTSEFFNLKVDDECKEDENPDDCQFDGYAIKLGGGIVYAESYNKWYEEKLITFFVDSDTEAYTVSQANFTPDGIHGCRRSSLTSRRSARSLCTSTSTPSAEL